MATYDTHGTTTGEKTKLIAFCLDEYCEGAGGEWLSCLYRPHKVKGFEWTLCID
jgi:hypothetical protein